VYGLDRQSRNREMVIVTEGQLDAIVTDGCATGRNNINDDQADILKSLEKQIIVLPDRDEAGKQMCKSAIRHGFSVSFPEWKDCKDASDALTKYGRLYTIRSIINSVEKNPTKIELLMRKVCK
jgi:DNA primase